MARGGPLQGLWDELDKIDFLLDEIARAVERGEIERSVYETLSPHYLARRANIVRLLNPPQSSPETGRTRAEGGEAALPAPPPAVRPSRPSQPSSPVRPTVPALPLGESWEPPASKGIEPERRPGIEIPVSAWLAFVGAFLVVVAVAIFTIYRWETFAPVVKLSFLGSVTALFYAFGWLVIERLRLRDGGVALVSVGSAMLLFDGWVVLEALGLRGPLPWAAILLLCSIAYWATELWLTGGWFGAFAAVAQVAWLWLLTRGLGWELLPSLAVAAAVSVLWQQVAERTPPEARSASLAHVLGIGAVPVAMLSTTAALFAVATEAWGGTSFADLAASFVVATAASTVLARLRGVPISVTAVAHAPVGLAALSLALEGRFAALSTLGVLALAYGAFAIWRGGLGYGFLAVAAESAFWLDLARLLEWRVETTLLIMAVVGVSWLVASALAATASRDDARSLPTLSQLGMLLELVGWLAIVLSSAALLIARDSATALAATAPDIAAAVSVAFFAAWLVAGIVRPRPVVGLVVAVVSVLAVMDVSLWLLPDVADSLRALVAVVVLVAWSLAAPAVAPRLGAVPVHIVWLVRVVWTAVAVLVPSNSLAEGAGADLPGALLLLGASIAWVADGLRHREPHAAAPAAAFLVAAAGWVGAVQGDAGTAAVAGTATGLVSSFGAFGMRNLSVRRWWHGGAIAASMLAAPLALAIPGATTIAFAATAVTWAVAAIADDEPWLAVGSPPLAGVALIAGVTAMSVPSWASAALIAGIALLLVVPTVMTARSASSSRGRRVADALAYGAVAMLGVHLIAPQLGDVVPAFAAVRGLHTHGYAGLLASGGVVTVLWSAVRDNEESTYVGWALILSAYFVELSTTGALIEAYTVPAAVYVALMGYLYAKREPGRRVPEVVDLLTVLLGLGVPALLSLGAVEVSSQFVHGSWALGMATIAIALGVALRVRAYFFAGLAVLAWEALRQSWSYLLAVPRWALLGALGVSLIAAGLLWERREALLAVATRRVRTAFEGWR